MLLIPCRVLYDPSAHATGATSLDAQYMPAGQEVQLLAPSREYCPEPHAAGVEVPPLAEQLLPAGHGTQPAEPAELL